MDLTTKTPDSENDNTPPHITQQLIKPLSFSNGTLKTPTNNHQQQQQIQQSPYQPPSSAVVYRECLKNHAASLGGHAVDGCGEFMQSPESTATDPTSLKCAACGCHRNFHRRYTAVEDGSLSPTTNISSPNFIDFRHHILPPPPIRRFSPSPSPPPQPHPVTPVAVRAGNMNGRKRFRTKFTQEQKHKMCAFSEKLGWKLHKCDDGVVEEFCNEIGVGKSVLRVWMHNNKNTFANKKELFNINNGTSTSNEEDHHNNNDSCGLHLHISTNASSSSS